jgi:hypothetical protein
LSLVVLVAVTAMETMRSMALGVEAVLAGLFLVLGLPLPQG